MNLLVTDIDDTLARNLGRGAIDDYLERQLAATNDMIIMPMVELVNAAHVSGWFVCCLTSRNERWRQLTHKWLYDAHVMCSHLIMRPDDNFDAAPEFKVAELLLLRPKFIDILAIDSRMDVINAYREQGFIALQSAP